jgi:hypothetical protein
MFAIACDQEATSVDDVLIGSFLILWWDYLVHVWMNGEMKKTLFYATTD